MPNDPNTPITQGNLAEAIAQMMQGLPTLEDVDASNGPVLCIGGSGGDKGTGGPLTLIHLPSSAQGTAGK